MAFRRRFSVRLASRTAVMVAASGATAALVIWGQAPTMMLLSAACTIGAVLSIWSLVNESNVELARFVVALERGDFGQSFGRPGRDTGFDRLGTAYDNALSRLREERTRDAGATRFARELVESVPIALLVIDDEQVAFVNRVARQTFGRSAPCSLATLAAVDPRFAATLRRVEPRRKTLGTIALDGFQQRVSLDTTTVHSADATKRIVAVKVIQAELDDAELAAQVDLVRVLTHEIMNSLTPVTSLATTASRLVRSLDGQADARIGDAQLALAALERRAVQLERFVESYKGFSQAPDLHRVSIGVAEWLDGVVLLFAATPLAERVTLRVTASENLPPLHIDVGLMTQVLLNLLKNGAEAASEGDDATVAVDIAAIGGDRIRLAVTDSGDGIPAHLQRDVFLPFFTTKPTGTGVGLSFARQIVLLHGGYIGVPSADQGSIELVLPTA